MAEEALHSSCLTFSAFLKNRSATTESSSDCANVPAKATDTKLLAHYVVGWRTHN